MKTLARVALAWCGIFAVTLAVLEASFFCCSSFLFPYAARIQLGFGIYPILQTSKSSTAPTHYIALFGDSYAFGQGDWFLQVQKERAPTFNVTHLLHARTGKDFISFGIPGSSNLTGWIEDPIATLTTINHGWRNHLPDPDHILLYFYEGNDIPDTARDLHERYVINGYDPKRLGDPEYFASFIEQEMLAKNQIYRQALAATARDDFYFLRLARLAIEKSLDLSGEQKKIDESIAALIRNRPPYTYNTARVGGQTIYLPDDLQAPPMDMTADELAQTLQFLDSIAGYVRQRYAGKRLSLVYIGSNASSYDISSQYIHVQLNPPDVRYTREAVLAMSNQLCQQMQALASRYGMDFLDTRPALRAAGQQQLLHGPSDTGHLNEAGYRALADALVPLLEPSQPATQVASGCANL